MRPLPGHCLLLALMGWCLLCRVGTSPRPCFRRCGRAARAPSRRQWGSCACWSRLARSCSAVKATHYCTEFGGEKPLRGHRLSPIGSADRTNTAAAHTNAAAAATAVAAAATVAAAAYAAHSLSCPLRPPPWRSQRMGRRWAGIVTVAVAPAVATASTLRFSETAADGTDIRVVAVCPLPRPRRGGGSGGYGRGGGKDGEAAHRRPPSPSAAAHRDR